MLTTLRLRNCKFEFDISTTHIRVNCLEDLYLHEVHISDAQLQRIIDRSPFIKTLTLFACPGISKLQVCGPVQLENLIVVWCKFYSVMVQAPNLQCFKYAVYYIDHHCEIAILDELNLTSCDKLKNIEIQSEKLKKFTLEGLKSLEKFTIQAPNLLEFDFYGGTKMPFSSMDPSSLERAQLNFLSPSTNFGSVDSSWYTNLHHFVKKINYSKGLILMIFCRKTKNIIIYENPREIVIPPSHDVVIFIAPILRVESIIGRLLRYCPRIMSIIPCTNSKILQVFSVLKGCTQKQNCSKECPFNKVFSNWTRKLEDVINCTGKSEEGMASIWYSWLKSTSLAN
ncbi:hypothetical protein R3W88_031448 [Solanum pinnatisectum]|uniref:F-box/LRR-repeat protein 15/At3g58940/PEG3-like LRR domain-containing protein n=1 Tax=Solanum pinnatisectum TaxID=50273 RepID=A0AAV9LLB9_9SOLN|nr:hypothetical protein R3W88_031448 [Solanum pinnatisectum]